jgi:ubiquitin-conjugating enzyme E2 O
VEVTLADSSVEVFPLERLTKLYDGMDHLDESWDEEGSFAGSEFSEEEDVAMLEVIGGDDGWQIHGGEEGDWEDVEDEDGQYDSASEEAQDWAMNEELAEAPTQSPPTKDSGSATPQPPTLVVTEASSTPGEPSRSATTSALRTSGIETEELPWERFEILPSAPVDHAFYATNPSQPSKNFMSRLTKEYRALTSSLPGTSLLVHVLQARLVVTIFRLSFSARV